MNAVLDDMRFRALRYSVPESAGYMGVPYGAMHKWVAGYAFDVRNSPVSGDPILHATRAPKGYRLTFASLVEAQVIAGLRRGTRGARSLQSLRRIVRQLRREIGDEWALASERLYVSGADVLWDIAERTSDEDAAQLVVIDSGQRVFHEALSQYLERIEYVDEYAGRIFLPITEDPVIVVDPTVNYGRPTFQSSGAPARPVLMRLAGGESIEAVANDYGIPIPELRQVMGERAEAVAS
ncbi:hypothetical protein BH23ACT9_BH23ACT9_05430 [soil metagenome]